MTDDLVKRLRDKTRLRNVHGLTGWVLHEEALLAEAADALERLSQQAKPVAWRDALEDCYGALVYIRSVHGDLYGVGWDRCMDKAAKALAAPPAYAASPLFQMQEAAKDLTVKLDEAVRLLRQSRKRMPFNDELGEAIDAYLAKVGK